MARPPTESTLRTEEVRSETRRFFAKMPPVKEVVPVLVKELRPEKVFAFARRVEEAKDQEEVAKE